MTSQSEPLAPPLKAHPYELDAIFDTCAIRHIGDLEKHEFRKLRRHATRAGLRTAWLGENLGELMVSNLRRKSGITTEDLRQIQVAAARFDQLCRGSMCASINTLVRRSIYKLAGADPPDPDPDDRGEGWLKNLAGFLLLQSASDIQFGADPNPYCVFGIPGTNIQASISLPAPFIPQATKTIEYFKDLLRGVGAPDALNEDKEVMHFWDRWVEATGVQLAIPGEVLERAFYVKADGARKRRPYQEVQRTAFALRLAPHHTYLARRISDRQPGLHKNDGTDVALAAYLSCAGRLVSDDVALVDFLHEVLDSRYTVVSLPEFRELLEREAR